MRRGGPDDEDNHFDPTANSDHRSRLRKQRQQQQQQPPYSEDVAVTTTARSEPRMESVGPIDDLLNSSPSPEESTKDDHQGLAVTPTVRIDNESIDVGDEIGRAHV